MKTNVRGPKGIKMGGNPNPKASAQPGGNKSLTQNQSPKIKGK